MIEVKCNGKTYLFNEGSEIQDHLDMTAAEVREDPRSGPARKVREHALYP